MRSPREGRARGPGAPAGTPICRHTNVSGRIVALPAPLAALGGRASFAARTTEASRGPRLGHIPAVRRLSLCAVLALSCARETAPTPIPDAPAHAASADPATHPAASPPLVIVLVVDQMRLEILDRLDPAFRGGFARLRRESLRQVGSHDMACTHTAPGHASIATGRYPRSHGVFANRVRDENGEEIETIVDHSVEARGGDGPPSSPFRLTRSTLGDWLKAESPDSKVFSVAQKDRTAILLGGRNADTAVWWDEDTGSAASSTWYPRELPEWARALSDALDLDAKLGAGWTLASVGDAFDGTFVGSTIDEQAGETPPRSFPHRGDEYRRGLIDLARYSDVADTFVLQLARRAIEAESLGLDEAPDILWVGLSSGDRIGHRFGPRSREIELWYRAIDRELGDFFDWLDHNRGTRGWLVVVTADHGVPDLPEWSASQGLDAVRVDMTADLEADARALSKTDACPARRVHLREDDEAIYLETQPELAPEQRQRCIDAAASRVAKHPWAADVFTRDALVREEGNSEFWELYARCAVAADGPDLFYRLPEHWVPSPGYDFGTAHGGPYAYDREVPLMWLSPAMSAAHTPRAVSDESESVDEGDKPGGPNFALVDLAPTLAALMGLAPPADLDGSARQSTVAAIRRLGWSNVPGDG